MQGYFLPHKNLLFSSYEADGVTYETHRIRTNNLGWISRNDYEPRKSGEYRIGVVGDSFTASLMNSTPWTDVVQETLNADTAFLASTGIKSFSVMNLGAVGASIPFMANPLAVVAKRLDVDMLIVNVITDALTRQDDGPRLSENITDLRPEWDKVSRPAKPDYILDDVGLNLFCTNGPPLLTNSDCKTSPFWEVPHNVSFAPEKILQIKRAIARQRYLWTVLLTPKPFLLGLFVKAMGSPAAAQEIPVPPQASDNVSAAVRALEFMRTLGENPLVIHNPVAADLEGTLDHRQFDSFAARIQNRFTVVDMRAYLPIQGGRDVWGQWYIPGDGHFNDTGAQVYGAAVARFVRERIEVTRNVERSKQEVVCLSLYGRFDNLMKAKPNLAPGQFAEGLREVVGKLPDLNELREKKRSYADCGFAVDAYLELALYSDGANGNASRSNQDWNSALKLAGNPALLLDRRYRERIARGDTAGALADLSELIRLRPDSTDLVLQRGDMRLAAQDAAGALQDFRLVRRRTGPVSTEFRIMQALWVLGNYPKVVETTTEGLARLPETPAYYHLRASAEERLGRLENALADYSAAIALSPNRTLYQLRANVLKELNYRAAANADREKAASTQ